MKEFFSPMKGRFSPMKGILSWGNACVCFFVWFLWLFFGKTGACLQEKL